MPNISSLFLLIPSADTSLNPESERDELHIYREPDGYPVLPTWDVDTPRSFKDVREVLTMFVNALWGR